MSMRPTRFAGFFSSPARSPNAALISFTVIPPLNASASRARRRSTSPPKRARRAPRVLTKMVLRAALLCAAALVAASDAPVPDEACRASTTPLASTTWQCSASRATTRSCRPTAARFRGRASAAGRPGAAQKPTKQAVLARFRRFLSDYDQYRGLVDAAEKANGTSAAAFLQAVEESGRTCCRRRCCRRRRRRRAPARDRAKAAHAPLKYRPDNLRPAGAAAEHRGRATAGVLQPRDLGDAHTPPRRDARDADGRGGRLGGAAALRQLLAKACERLARPLTGATGGCALGEPLEGAGCAAA